MWSALLLTLPGSAASAVLPEYDRYEPFELALCAERVVTGEIQSVGASTFLLQVEERIVGEDIPDVLEVRRFENWTCASRWTAYQFVPGPRPAAPSEVPHPSYASSAPGKPVGRSALRHARGPVAARHRDPRRSARARTQRALPLDCNAACALRAHGGAGRTGQGCHNE